MLRKNAAGRALLLDFHPIYEIERKNEINLNHLLSVATRGFLVLS